MRFSFIISALALAFTATEAMPNIPVCPTKTVTKTETVTKTKTKTVTATAVKQNNGCSGGETKYCCSADAKSNADCSSWDSLGGNNCNGGNTICCNAQDMALNLCIGSINL